MLILSTSKDSKTEWSVSAGEGDDWHRLRVKNGVLEIYKNIFYAG